IQAREEVLAPIRESKQTVSTKPTKTIENGGFRCHSTHPTKLQSFLTLISNFSRWVSLSLYPLYKATKLLDFNF
uniref:hypothetical protein n=1 Tax=Candidatus Marithrix sp. Canyon 246 TaxID=1827136 RepID=UPI001C0E1972